MNLRPINAPDAPQPLGGYVQAMEVSSATRMLFISGQIPVTADGHVPETFEAQARLTWKNLIAQLNAAYRKVRNEVLQGRQVGLTTIITGIFDEKWLLEIEAIAAG